MLWRSISSPVSAMDGLVVDVKRHGGGLQEASARDAERGSRTSVISI